MLLMDKQKAEIQSGIPVIWKDVSAAVRAWMVETGRVSWAENNLHTIYDGQKVLVLRACASMVAKSTSLVSESQDPANA